MISDFWIIDYNKKNLYYGFFVGNGLVGIRNILDAGCTIEGDNVVLLQQTARYRLKIMEELEDNNDKNINPSIYEIISKSSSPDEQFFNNSVQLVHTTKTHIETFIMRMKLLSVDQIYELERKITSEDLYLWSIPIDIIENYEIYIETNDISLEDEMITNCTLPRFGSMCQYEFYYYHRNYSSLYEIIHGYYKSYEYDPPDLTCYLHLQCNRDYASVCLDWTEICNGKLDCLDGPYDEEHCWQLEFIECNEHEYQCQNGLCIPNEFVNDNVINFDCLDRSDEINPNLDVYRIMHRQEPAFGYEDAICQNRFLTNSCFEKRHDLLLKSIFSIKDQSISNQCWFALQYYFGIKNSMYSSLSINIMNNICKTILKENCSETLVFPNIPIFFGHIYMVFNTNNLSFPYLCSNQSHFTYDISINYMKCLSTDLNLQLIIENEITW
ncbi:unnamed protein product [Adineta ricciae]|uniref:Uncharacterized protein n=1 Tax=Adineta ricciae TaxID=249248 RepID=A0A815TUR5_ADIRI|nr:unnamed protein product [Adineta ricciae]